METGKTNLILQPRESPAYSKSGFTRIVKYQRGVMLAVSGRKTTR